MRGGIRERRVSTRPGQQDNKNNNMDDKQRWGHWVWLGLACYGIPGYVQAAQWALSGDLAQQLQYNDNMNFTATQKDAEFGYRLLPALKAGLKTPAWQTQFLGQGDIRRYDHPRWDCDAYLLGLDNHYAVRRNSFSLAGGYSLSCAYQQQLTDTGILVPNTQVENFRVAPSWQWRWTRRSEISLETGYSKTNYGKTNLATLPTNGSTPDNPLSTGFIGNKSYSLRLGANHRYNRQTTLNGGTYFSRVEYTEPGTATQEIYGFQFGVNYAPHRRWLLSLGAGPRWTHFEAVNLLGSEQAAHTVLGNVGNISLNYKDRGHRFSIGYSNSISPSAIGQVQDYHNAFLDYTYRVSRRVVLETSVNFLHSEAVDPGPSGNSADNFKRDYVSASAAVSWEFAKDWRLQAGYTYRWQEYRQTSATIESNTAMLSVSYSWEGIQGSR